MSTPPPQQVHVVRIPGTGAVPPEPAAIRTSRFIAAFAIAILSDALSMWLEFLPPLQWVLDGVTALALFALLGRRWQILPGLIAEAIPGLAVLPFWILVVLSIFAAQAKGRRSSR